MCRLDYSNMELGKIVGTHTHTYIHTCTRKHAHTKFKHKYTHRTKKNQPGLACGHFQPRWPPALGTHAAPSCTYFGQNHPFPRLAPDHLLRLHIRQNLSWLCKLAAVVRAAAAASDAWPAQPTALHLPPFLFLPCRPLQQALSCGFQRSWLQGWTGLEPVFMCVIVCVRLCVHMCVGVCFACACILLCIRVCLPLHLCTCVVHFDSNTFLCRPVTDNGLLTFHHKRCPRKRVQHHKRKLPYKRRSQPCLHPLTHQVLHIAHKGCQRKK